MVLWMRIFILHETKQALEDVDLRVSHTFLEVCVSLNNASLICHFSLIFVFNMYFCWIIQHWECVGSGGSLIGKVPQLDSVG